MAKSSPTLKPEDLPQLIDKSVKTMRMRQNLAHVQTKLKPSDKRLSEAVHQPLVQLISEAAGKTIARPSGLLGGGLVAFLGGLVYQLLTRHYNLSYDFFFFALFFGAGFILGVVAEYLLTLLHRVRR